MWKNILLIALGVIVVVLVITNVRANNKVKAAASSTTVVAPVATNKLSTGVNYEATNIQAKEAQAARDERYEEARKSEVVAGSNEYKDAIGG